jgi:serine protease Do
MKKISFKFSLLAAVSLISVIGLGLERFSNHPHPVVEPILSVGGGASNAYAQNLDRGFADLAKKVMPGVVNISTYVRPRMARPQFGGGLQGRDEMFQRFFEEFFGGRMGPPNRMMPRGEDESEEESSAPKAGKPVQTALGTGFIIDEKEGLILTNHHVIQGAEEVRVQFKEEDSELAPAEIIGRDPELDVALLKVKNGKLTSIPMGDSDAVEVGEYVLAVGNPLGYGHTVSHGILSAKGRRNPEFRMGKYLQTDASINPGNSGGPLINMRGEVIGINNAIDARAQGIGFAIPINLVKAVLGQLKSKGSVSRGFLGVSVADFTPEIAQHLQLDSKLRGVIVSDLTAGSPAAGAGLKPYDVITSVNGEKITNAQDLTGKVTSIPVGEKAVIEFYRAGKMKSVTVKVAERPVAGMPIRNKKEKAFKGAQSAYSEFGFHVADISPQNASRYGVPPEVLKGKCAVVVSEIEYNKPAANSGLARGDLILDVGGKEVRTVVDLDKLLKDLHGKSAMIRVKRFDSNGGEWVSVIVISQE